jgi:hypothetical protein
MFSIVEWINGGIKVLQEDRLDFPNMPMGLPPVSHNVLFIEKENIDEFLKTIQEYKHAK